MINVILSGVGGQGTVLAAKVLAAAAARQGRRVRSAETIGMSQRGGSVVSHVRIADAGEDVHASLVMHGRADAVIAFEPGEAARVLPYLAPAGTLVSATTPIEPVSAALSQDGYDAGRILDGIERALSSAPCENGASPSLIRVDDARIIRGLEGGRKVLNSVMLACAVHAGCLPFTIEDLKAAVASCVKPAFVDMNTEAIDAAVRGAGAMEQE